jgi:hypothetical protein
MEQMFCEIDGCGYKMYHTTDKHECGKCHNMGHGQNKCPLMKKPCDINGCRYKSLHETKYHVCGNCNQHGHGRIECKNKQLLVVPHGHKITNTESVYVPSIVSELAPMFVSLKLNCYTASGAGMGCMIYARNNNNIIEYLFLHDTDEQNAHKSPHIRGFLNGYHNAQ